MTLAAAPTTSTPTPEHPQIEHPAARFAVWSARFGIVTAAAASLAIFAVDLFAARQGFDPMRATLSQHSLRAEGWVFTTAMILLACGSAGIAAALVTSGIARLRSSASVASGMWCAGLLLVASFTKHDWSAGPSPSGYAHWTGALLAFLSVPLASVMLARPWLGDPRWRLHAGMTAGLGLLAVACIVPIAAAMALHITTGVPWWETVHLGLVERLLAVAEVVAILAAGKWAVSASAQLVPLRTSPA